MGVEDFEINRQTKNESGGRLGELQKDNVEGDEGKMDEDEIAHEGRQLGRGHQRYDSATVNSELADYIMVEE